MASHATQDASWLDAGDLLDEGSAIDSARQPPGYPPPTGRHGESFFFVSDDIAGPDSHALLTKFRTVVIQRVLKKIGVLKSLVPGNPEDKPSEDVEANASSSKSSKQQLSLVQTKVACLQLLLLRVQHLALSPPGRQDMGLHVVMPWMPGLWVNPA